jgi:putative Mg2+ transporter-C (MgtC) family protein
MSLTLGWTEIAIRLLLTVLAGAVIGWNRGEHGHPAGLRTTILVCLAASLAMIEANLLLNTRGKPIDSFVALDLARLPLGILSGMGFIGAGAILRRDHIVEGITTAATLWFVTVVGLCIGAGQTGLGVVATAIGYLVLSVLKRVETIIGVERRATLDIVSIRGTELGNALAAELSQQGYQFQLYSGVDDREQDRQRCRYEIRWHGREHHEGPAELLNQFAGHDGIIELRWRLGSP